MAPVTVSVKTIGGDVYCHEMEAGMCTTIADLAKVLCEKHEYQTHGLKLIYSGKVGAPTDTLKDMKYDEGKKFVLVGKREKSMAGSAAKRARMAADERKREETRKAEEAAKAASAGKDKDKEGAQAGSAQDEDAAAEEKKKSETLNRGLRAMLKVFLDVRQCFAQDMEEDMDGNQAELHHFMPKLREAEEYSGQFLEMCHYLRDPVRREEILQLVKSEMPEFFNSVQDEPESFLVFLQDVMVAYAQTTGAPAELLDHIIGLEDCLDFGDDFDDFGGSDDDDDDDGGSSDSLGSLAPEAAMELFGSLGGSSDDVLQSIEAIRCVLESQGVALEDGHIQLVPRGTGNAGGEPATQIAGMERPAPSTSTPKPDADAADDAQEDADVANPRKRKREDSD